MKQDLVPKIFGAKSFSLVYNRCYIIMMYSMQRKLV